MVHLNENVYTIQECNYQVSKRIPSTNVKEFSIIVKLLDLLIKTVNLNYVDLQI